MLVATVTDGDIRRALLAGSALDDAAEAAYNTAYVFLREGSDWPTELRNGRAQGLAEYPVVDDRGVLISVEVLPERNAAKPKGNTVVIMAGGKGMRLRPLTEKTPKPLLEVNGKPILQHIIENLRDEGFRDIVIAVNYLGEQIEGYFGDGSAFGLSLRYLREEQPLGTAGALSLLKTSPGADDALVVMNADLVFSARIGDMVDYHTQENAHLTVGAKIVETTVPFGVLSTRGNSIEGIEEKPTRRDLVNAGVYVVNGELLTGLSPDQPIDMPEFISRHLLDRKVIAFPLHEDWLDLGRPDDLQKAQLDAEAR